jgi:uncharacterized protein YjiK
MKKRLRVGMMVVVALCSVIVGGLQAHAAVDLNGNGYSEKVLLRWTDTSGAADYAVEYALAGSGVYTVFDDGVSALQSAVVTGLQNGTAYDFKVTNVDTSEISNVFTLAPQPIISFVSPTPANGATLSTSTAGISALISSLFANNYELSILKDSDGSVVASDAQSISTTYALNAVTAAVTNQDLTAGEDNYSGVAYVPTTDTLFMVRNSRDQIKEVSLSGSILRTITCSTCGDIEGIALVGSVDDGNGGYNHTFMISTEDAGKIFRVTIPSAGAATVNAADYYNTGISHGLNTGLEGVAYDATAGKYYVAREKTPALYEVTLGASSTATSAQICANINIGSIVTDLSDLAFAGNTLFVLSHEGVRVIAVDVSNPASCVVKKQLTSLPIVQAEGVTWNDDGTTMYVLGEPDLLTTYTFSGAKVSKNFTSLPNDTYRAEAQVTDGFGITEVLPYRVFTVAVSTSTPDTTAPVISSVAVTTTSNSATVTWVTSEAATSYVRYGLTTSYGLTATSTGSTSHSVTLGGLSANTKYNYKIFASDAANNLGSTGNLTFTTKKVQRTSSSR